MNAIQEHIQYIRYVLFTADIVATRRRLYIWVREAHSGAPMTLTFIETVFFFFETGREWNSRSDSNC